MTDVKWVVGETVTQNLARVGERVATAGLTSAVYSGAGVLLHTATERIHAYAHDTGALADSGHRQMGEADRHHAVAAVGWDAEQAVYIEFGTGIYGTGPGATGQPITPKTARVLHWVDKAGQDHFARSVRGITPRPFLRPALDESQAEVLQAMGQAIRSALGGL